MPCPPRRRKHTDLGNGAVGVYPSQPGRRRCPPPREATTMSDTPPDRLSNDPRSPHFNEELLSKGVGIRFNGQEKTNVEEYSVAEGWIKVAAGRSRDRFGNPMTSW